MASESVKQRKVADRVKQLVSVIIDRKLNDPDKGFITVTNVRMSKDLGIAFVYFTTLGDEDAREKSAAVLERAKTFIRNELGAELNMRFVPEIRFFYDDTMDQAQRIEDLLATIKKPDENEQ